ncbi:hypothetical protein K7432_002177 [Basidiobolus ranarum]|uniref:Arrestin C-terminal-like domain-containing protein n=1 Tax=Basidiobolus ranarum TaxID=34480 RepID=A0ABR2W8C5_9FUNG
MTDDLLDIQLRENVLTMHGSPEESVGSVLSGSLVFNVTELTKVKSITLKFEGKLEFKGDKDVLVDTSTVTQHTWNFLEQQRSHYNLPPSKHIFNFELPLSGDLPESVRVNYGMIVYRLVAVVKRPGLFKDLKTKREVKIQRAPLPSMVEYTNNNTVTGIWDQRLEYSVSSPSPSYTFGDSIPIKVTLRPKAGHYPFRVLKVKASLSEYTLYRPSGSVTTVTRVEEISDNVHDCFGMESSFINETIQVHIPRIARNDCLTNFINVSHKLLVRIYMIDCHRRQKILYSNIPVVIQSDTQLELSQSPPNYTSYLSDSSDDMCTPPPYYDFNQYSSSVSSSGDESM